jgi:hypothetical protein
MHELQAGDNWKKDIRRIIESCDFAVVLFSNEYYQRENNFVKEELAIAIAEYRKNDAQRPKIIPVLLDEGLNLPEYKICEGEMLRDLNWVDLSKNWEVNVKKIIKRILPCLIRRPEMIKIPPVGYAKSSELDSRIRPFWIGKYTVTQYEWEEVMGENPSNFTGDPNRPVEQISWEDIQNFITELNNSHRNFISIANSSDGELKYRLPSELEWEFACKAGFVGEFGFDENEEILEEYAWIISNSEGETHPVGTRKANPWGLHDMHGNVCEWVSDVTFVQSTQVNTGTEYPTKGGSFDGDSKYCLASNKTRWTSNFRYYNLGFRLAGDVIQ